MTRRDQTANLRARRAQVSGATGNGLAASGNSTARPADLVITAEMIPDPVETGATGDLTHAEAHDLGVCERAVDNVAKARWLAGKALQSIRDRRLYRNEFATFEDYVQARWEMSVRAAYHLIEEWSLAQGLQEVLGRPATPSHVRALLPVSHGYGLGAAVDLYVQLAQRAASDGLRLTAAVTGRIVELLVQQAGAEAEVLRFTEITRELMSADALPLAAAAPARRAALPAVGSAPTEPPRAPESATPDAEGSVQNSAESHGEVTVFRAAAAPTSPVVVPDREHELGNADEMIPILLAILQMTIAVEHAIDSAIAYDPMDDGKAEELRQEIRRRLLRAAQPYRL